MQLLVVSIKGEVMIAVTFSQLIANGDDHVVLIRDDEVTAIPPPGTTLMTIGRAVGEFGSTIKDIYYDILKRHFTIFCGEIVYSDREQYLDAIRFLKRHGWKVDEEHSSGDDPTL
jgi:hypothetical protein